MWKRPTLASVVLALMGTLSSAPAAEDKVRQAAGTFCDTKEQAIRFLTEWDGTNTPELLARVNAESEAQNRCRVATVSYVVLRRYNVYQTPKGDWQVIEALILKIGLPTGRVVQPRTPVIWYSYAQPSASDI